jgi:alpha-ketoglutarate-dependent taurine dioxygenase
MSCQDAINSKRQLIQGRVMHHINRSHHARHYHFDTPRAETKWTYLSAATYHELIFFEGC